MNPFIIGIPAFVACSFGGYLLRELSLGRISAEQLGNLSSSMRPTRLRYLVVMAATLTLFIVARFSLPSFTDSWFVIFLGITAVVTVGFEFHSWRACNISALPRAFTTPYLLSRIVSVAGILLLLLAMIATVFVPLE